MSQPKYNYAYATLLTRSSYLAGAVLLAFSLQKHGSQYPLVILYTDNLSDPAMELLESLREHLHIILSKVSVLEPRAEQCTPLIAERFADTWTKLRVFQLVQFSKICFLDADMLVMKHTDSLLDLELPGDDWLAATPVCCCNLDKDAWAPEEWVPQNCPFTHQKHPDALQQATHIAPNSPPTYHLLNGGMFVFHPSLDLWLRMQRFFDSSPLIPSFKFPDQDFLTEFFRDKWLSVSWQYNALKTMRYWHPNIWRDDHVCCLHYIVDKPWANTIRPGSPAGYAGKDGETHQWWWDELAVFFNSMKSVVDPKALDIMKQHIAHDDEDTQCNEPFIDFGMIGSQAQEYAMNFS